MVDPRSMPAFERAVERLGAKVNKFGGYGIALDRWKVDVWPLERTWAAVNGHVPVATLHDLVDVTFFDWDAVLYSVDEQRLIAKSCYFDRVRRRVIDINLEPNPNPSGTPSARSVTPTSGRPRSARGWPNTSPGRSGTTDGDG